MIQQEEPRPVPHNQELDQKADRVPAEEGFSDYDPAIPDQSTHSNGGSAVVSASGVVDTSGEDGPDDEQEVSSQPTKRRRTVE